jgi:hypothetical protein
LANVLKRLTLIFVLSLAAVSAFAEENYGLNAPSFLPLSAQVGDPVLYHVELVVPDHARIVPPPMLPKEPEIEISDVKVREIRKLDSRTVYAVNVYYVSFAPGSQMLPPLDLGDVTLRDVEIRTLSVLAADEIVRVSPSRDQIVLPGTLLFMTSIALALVGFVGAIIGGIILSKKLASILAVYRKRRIPARHLAKSLRSLCSRSKRDSAEFFDSIALMTRTYLSERLEFPALTFTTSEIRDYIGDVKIALRAREEVSGILMETDRIKFGGDRITGTATQNIIERVTRLSSLIDEGASRVGR